MMNFHEKPLAIKVFLCLKISFIFINTIECRKVESGTCHLLVSPLVSISSIADYSCIASET